MKTNNKTWLTPALRLVKKHAPNTYEAMINADWKVYAVHSEKDLLPVTRQLSKKDTRDLVDQLNKGLAITIAGKENEDIPVWVKLTSAGPPDPLKHHTFVNVNALRGQAHHGGVSPVHLAAAVLVHEWWHRRGYGERKAYDAGTRFALAMGQPRIAEMSEKTKAKVAA